jgi:signal transduction histidine kinase/sensor domain CHASE-containing protein
VNPVPTGRTAAALAVVLLSAALAVYAAHLTRQNEIRSARSDFEGVAEHIIVDLRRELEGCMDVVRLTASIFDGPTRPSRERFSVFARAALTGRGGLRALAFAPRVPQGGRAALEAAMSREEIPGFIFTQMAPSGALEPAGARPEYYPVLYAEPLAGNEAALGYDIGSNETRLAALRQAWQTGDTTATARVRTVQAAPGSWGVLLVEPVFPGGLPPSTPEERERGLMGFALAVFQMDALMSSALVDVASERVLVELEDASAPPDERTLYVRPMPAESGDGGGALPAILPTPVFEAKRTLVVGQRTWDLRLTSTPEFFTERLTWRPLQVAGSGLAITVLLGMYLFQSLRLLAVSDARAAERRQAEREARDEEKKLQTILSGIKAATFTIDARTFTIQDMNRMAEKLFRVCAKDWIGKPHADLLGRNLRPLDSAGGAVRPGHGRVEAVAGGEFLLSRPGGALVPLSRTVLSTSDTGGQYIIEVLFDISEKKSLERQLGLSQKLEAVGQLASGIAHEINTPIQYIGGNLGFLKEAFEGIMDVHARFEALVRHVRQGLPADEPLAELDLAREKIHYESLLAEIPGSITDSISGVERVAGIVGAMKKFSHPDAGGKRLVDVNKAIEATLTISRNEWKYDSEMRSELDPGLPLVHCSPGDFNQVLLNVVVNAAHAVSERFHGTGVKGLITVSTVHENGVVAIRVADTGVGIPPENLDRIFDPFFTTKEVGKGTGQGLAIVHSIVEKHGGFITIESEPGQGTAFTIRLPSGEGAEAGQEESA